MQYLPQTFDMPRATAIESEMFTALIALLATTDRRLVIVVRLVCNQNYFEKYTNLVRVRYK